jgi:hypothetical protein
MLSNDTVQFHYMIKCHAAVENGENMVLEKSPTTTIIDGSTPLMG